MLNQKEIHLPPGYSIFQTLLKSPEFLNNPVNFISKSMTGFGDSYTASVRPGQKIILTQNPDFINYVLRENHKNYKKSKLSTENAAQFFGKGLLFSNGDYWLRQRRLIQPAFHKEKIQGLSSIIIRCIKEFLKTFPTGEAIDIYPVVHRLSFRILMQSLFNIDIHPKIEEEIREIFSALMEFLLKDANQPYRRILYPITQEKKDLLKKAGRLRAIIGDIIDIRQSGISNHTDLLDMLLNSKYEDSGEPLLKEQVIDELLIIIFAGHETTANSLSWLLHLLTENPDKLEKLNQSINRMDAFESMHSIYLKAVINEGMRLFPAAWMTERVAIADDRFGEFSFRKNTVIILYFFGLHRHNEHWDAALRFKPERFIDDPSLFKSKNFFPFGAGPRMCIGNNFALMEMAYFLHLFFNQFTIKATAQIPGMKPLITLRPDKVILQVEKK